MTRLGGHRKYDIENATTVSLHKTKIEVQPISIGICLAKLSTRNIPATMRYRRMVYSFQRTTYSKHIFGVQWSCNYYKGKGKGKGSV